MKFGITTIFVYVLTCFSHLSAQEFLEGINLYNRAEYDSVIFSFVPQFIKENPHEEGLARYFLAESYYNKAINETDPEKTNRYFQEARRQFEAAQSSQDLKANFEEYQLFCQYKKAWCSFRLAELAKDEMPQYKLAFNEFTEVAIHAPDSIKVFSHYMAAESSVRLARFLYYKMIDSEVDEDIVREALNSLEAAERFYSMIREMSASISSPGNLSQIQAISSLKEEMVRYEKAKLYSTIIQAPPSIRDSLGIANFRGQAVSLLTELDYTTENFMSSETINDGVSSYFELMKHLNLYFLRKTNSIRENFLTRWQEFQPEVSPELFFRRANLYQSNPNVDSEEFNEWSLASYDSASSITESFYWRGYLQMVQGDDSGSIENLEKFIFSQQARPILSDRERILLEDGIYRKLLLEFEAYYLSKDFTSLRNLALQAEQFSPQNKIIAERQKQLNLLINCSLTRNTAQIWNDVLVGTDEEKLEQALETIRFILPRAALNIGIIRERYLTLLNRLFDVTRNRRTNETRYFMGVVKSLEAEIEGTQQLKIKSFKEAAEIFDSIDDGFVYKEADYVRARSLFFAEEYEQAKEILSYLISEQKYLRAAFYLAEIYRVTDQGLRAKLIYEKILEKLESENFVYDEFWKDNARAGLESAGDSGWLTESDSINFDDIELQQPGNASLWNYEILAEEKFLKQNFAYESVDWLMKLGLPQKDIYPSPHRLDSSLVEDVNVFENVPYVLDEVRGPITSTLHLLVILPDRVDPQVEVMLAGEPLQSIEGIYIKKSIPLNSELDLTIRNADCYEFRQSYRFSKPGLDRHEVRLNKKLSFVASGFSSSIFDDPDYTLSYRWDKNFILNQLPNLADSAQILDDFADFIEFRDCVLDSSGGRILAVNSETNEIWIYDSTENSRRLGTLSTSLKLNSPEGIAVNSVGHIFIADWGNHRVVELDQNGRLVSSIGRFGSNHISDVGSQVRLTYPTRLAIVEHPEKQTDGTEAIFQQDYLYIADRNGLHICKLDGTFLATLIAPTTGFEKGSFYAFSAIGYGEESKLYLVQRLSDERGRLVEFVSN